MECIEKQSAHSIPPLPHTTLIRYHAANQNGYIASTQPIGVSSGSDSQQPTLSDFACCIGADAVHAVPNTSSAAEHTRRPSLPKLQTANSSQLLKTILLQHRVYIYALLSLTQEKKLDQG